MGWSELSHQWKETIKLKQPIAIAFVEHPPEGISRVSEVAPSACTYWRRGEQELFYTTAEDHYNCPIGLMTMGFSLSAEKHQEAQTLVATMASLHYFDPAEVQYLPTIKKAHNIIVYGPLENFPIDPDIIILMLTPYQAMLASEALGGLAWAEQPRFGMFGRPACAAIPMAEQLSHPTASLGCIGARTYLSILPAEMLMVIPAAQFSQATAKLVTIADANQQLAGYHNERAQTISTNH
ncbi:MAG: DUF169 domain-containing protein [Acidobacteriota bacterium]